MLAPFLHKGDQICIISPSGAITPTYIDGASHLFKKWGFTPVIAGCAKNSYGRFAGTKEERVADLQAALDKPNIRAILCSRGGYGLAQIIDCIDFSRFVESPKWLIGFSDISILHSVLSNLGIASVHGMMAKHLTELDENNEQIIQMREILTGSLPTYKLLANPSDKVGKTTGKLVGGNLSVLAGMRGTPYDLEYKNNILFVEEISEKPYHIDRMIQNLRLSGVFQEIKGLIVGQFSDCDEDPLMKQSIIECILEAVKYYDYPVCFDFPAGHIDDNRALILGTEVELEVTSSNTTLQCLNI